MIARASRRLLVLSAPLLLLVAARAGEMRPVDVPLSEAPYPSYLRYAPRTNAPRLDWLLVTPRDLVEPFLPLVRHRRDLGLAADVVAMEDVDRDLLLGGGDLPERLRNLVRLLHARYGLRFLVLGADTDRLPARMAPFPIRGENVHYGEPYAVDAYFGCLDGEWNRDADARFGEAEPGDDDDPDVRAEVYVGRIPVESPQEVETYVHKLLLYERPTHLDYQDQVIYLGGKVFSEGDADRFYHQLYQTFFQPHGFTARFFTRDHEGASVREVLDALSEGAGIVCHYHHSFTYNLSLPRGALDTGNVGEVRNAERPFVMFSNGCYANQYTKEGISERLLLSPAGGAVAFIGSTDTCFTSSLQLEKAFWEIELEKPGTPIGEGLALVRGDVRDHQGVMGFLRLSFNLAGDPATRVWPGRPAPVTFEAKPEADGGIHVALAAPAKTPLRVACVEEGPWGAWREPVEMPPGATAADLPPAVGNGTPLRVTLSGLGVVPATTRIPDPLPVHVKEVRVDGGVLHVLLAGAKDLEVTVPGDLAPGPWRIERTVGKAPLTLTVPVLDGRDRGFVKAGSGERRYPGFLRMGASAPGGVPLVTGGPPELVEAEAAPKESAAHLTVAVEATEATIRLGWTGTPGARWLVARVLPGGRRELLTPVPLSNPVFEETGLAPLTTLDLVLSRLGAPGETPVTARTSFAFQRGFPARVGSNVTSVQLLDLGGKRGKEIVFGDDAKGLWAFEPDGSEVRHAGDAWTFGLFAAIEGGVFEPVVANVAGSRRPEILATGKLKDRKLYAFHMDGTPLPGFPVSFRSRLMTPPLVGDFDGKRGNEILVVSGFGREIDLVHPDGTTEKLAEVAPYNYAYPIAVNLDRDKALEVVMLAGDGKVHVLDQGGKEPKGFPVDLGSPGRATPMVADLDRDRALEIVAVGRGTTHLAVIDAKTGEIQAEMNPIPDAGKPDNDSFFYPGLAHLDRRGPPSIVVGTPSAKLFAIDLVDGKSLVVRKGFPLDLPSPARGVAAIDVDRDGVDELFLALHDGEVWGLRADGTMLPGFPLLTSADTYAVPLLEDLDHDGDLELFLGAADGMLRVWDLPYETPTRPATWPGLLGGSGMPGTPGH